MRRAGIAVSSFAFWLALLLSLAGSGYHAQTLRRPATPASASPGPNEGTFLLLSDIHLDPLTGTDPQVVQQLLANPVDRWQSIFESSPDRQISTNGADSNYALLASALEAARRSGHHYDYVIITGDFLGHDMSMKYSRLAHRDSDAGYREFAIRTIVFVNRMVQQAFPGVPIVETLGNNDSVEGDYMDAGAPLLETLAKEWKIVADSPDATRDFLKGGYYAVPDPFVPNQEFVILNTAFWSNRYPDSSTGAVDPGFRELAWLKSELDRAQAAHKNITLLMHIPPGIDAYKSSQTGGCNPALFWKKPYQDSFLAILEAHASQIRDGYAGHTHMDDFTLVDDASGAPYFQIHITPSISRDHRNNPSFETGVYDKANGAFVDYMATYLQSSSAVDDGSQAAPVWVPEYDFRQLSHLPMYSPSSLQAIALLIRSNDLIRQKFLDLYVSKASSSGSAPVKDWLTYSCAQTEISLDSFRGCACPNPGAGR